MTFKEVGELLFISSRNCVRWYVDAFYTSGNVDLAHHKYGPLPMLDQFEQLTVLQSPSMFFDGLQQELANITGADVHISRDMIGNMLFSH